MPPFFQLVDRRFRKPFFHHEKPFGLVEEIPPRNPSGCLERRLDVQAEIEDRSHDLNMSLGLPVGPAGPEDKEGFPVPEGHGSHEGVEGPLVGLEAVHMVRVQREVSSPVLKHDSRVPGRHGRPEGIVEGLDQGDGVSRFIYRTEVNGIPPQISRGDGLGVRRSVLPDKTPASRGVIFRKEIIDGNLDLLRVGDIPVPIGEGHFLGLHHVVKVVGRLIPQGGQVVTLEEVQHEEGGQALGVGGRLVNRVAPVRGGDGVPPVGPVIQKILLRQKTADFPAEADDLPGDFPLVEHIPSFPGDLFQGRSQAWVGEDVPRPGSFSSRQE